MEIKSGMRDFAKAGESVYGFYQEQHAKQTYEFAMAMHNKYKTMNVGKSLGVWESLEQLDKLVDLSDPDIESSQLQHALQAAETARALYPDEKDDWLVLVALIHDLGKMLVLNGEPQWAVVGDTFPVGCRFDHANIHHPLFAANPDSKHPIYATENGVYTAGCGFRNILFSWGHDEYLYQVLKRSGTTLPNIALHVIRFHSFYPWHTKGAYGHLADVQDRQFLPWLQAFQKCDLYSKTSKLLDPTTLKPFYQSLIQKYIPSNLLLW
jgi:inositol oxygenase